MTEDTRDMQPPACPACGKPMQRIEAQPPGQTDYASGSEAQIPGWVCPWCGGTGQPREEPLIGNERDVFNPDRPSERPAQRKTLGEDVYTDPREGRGGKGEEPPPPSPP